MTIIETATAPQAQQRTSALLDVKDLRVTFKTPDGDVTAVNDLNFDLRAGETLGIVGESGSGKSQTAFALMGLLAANGVIGGSAKFNGREILNLPEQELNKLRAEQIAMMRFGFVIDLSNWRKAAIGSPDNKAITNPATKSTSRVSKRFTSAQTVTNTTATAIQIVQLIVSPDNYCVLIDRSFP